MEQNNCKNCAVDVDGCVQELTDLGYFFERLLTEIPLFVNTLDHVFSKLCIPCWCVFIIYKQKELLFSTVLSFFLTYF